MAADDAAATRSAQARPAPSACWCWAIPSPPATACRARTGSSRSSEAALQARGIDVTIVDGAVSGDTTAGGRARLDWALADGADAAIVELGANDGLRGVDPKDMEANLTAILDALAARHIPVLLAGMYAPPNLGPDYGKRVPRGLRAAEPAAGRPVRPVLPGGRGRVTRP